jgi:hypothetical protein
VCQDSSEAIARGGWLHRVLEAGWRCDVGSMFYPEGMHYHRGVARGATSRSSEPLYASFAWAATGGGCGTWPHRRGRYISSPVQGVGP